MAKGLTEKQRKVLEFVIDFHKAHGFSPTIRELGERCEINSLRGVTVHLDALVRKGFLTRERSISRSIRVVGPDPREAVAINGASRASRRKAVPGAGESFGVRLPLLRAPSGAQAGARLPDKRAVGGRIEQLVFVPQELAEPATARGFVIRVGARGVRGEAILPGDLVVVRPQSAVPEGDLGVYLDQGDFALCRADAIDADASVTNPRSDAEPVGRVVGLIRRY